MFGLGKKTPEKPRPEDDPAYNVGQEAGAAMTAEVTRFFKVWGEPHLLNIYSVFVSQVVAVREDGEHNPIDLTRTEMAAYTEAINEWKAHTLPMARHVLEDWFKLAEQMQITDLIEQFVTNRASELWLDYWQKAVADCAVKVEQFRAKGHFDALLKSEN